MRPGAANVCVGFWHWRQRRFSMYLEVKRFTPQERLNACMPTAWFMTICPAWMTMTCAGVSRRCTSNGMKPLRFWWAMRCKASPLNCWPIQMPERRISGLSLWPRWPRRPARKAWCWAKPKTSPPRPPISRSLSTQ